MTQRVQGTLGLGGQFPVLPRGSLTVGEPRELVVTAAVPGAFEPNGKLAKDTLARDNPRGLVRIKKDDLEGDLVSAPLTQAGSYPFPFDLAPDELSDEEVVGVHDEEVVWGGVIHFHYGHFLVESVARLWPLLPGAELEGLPVVFALPWPLAFARAWLDAFGARVVALPEKGAVRFTKMRVPEPAWRVNGWLAPELRDIHLHTRRRLNVTQSAPREVLWLSRSNLRHERSAYDEHLLEFILGEHISPFHPESTSLAAQVAAFEASRAVAGVRGSAFHTLLLAEAVPEASYLCPPWDKGTYPAQHKVLGSGADFARALAAPVEMSQMRRRILAGENVAFPGGYRIEIPRALNALRDSVSPALYEDPRVMAFAEAGGRRDAPRAEGSASDLDAAALRVVAEPHSLAARMELGGLFEEEGLDRCALEQFATVADLGDVPTVAPLHAARILHRIGRREDAAAMAQRVLAVDPNSREALAYLDG